MVKAKLDTPELLDSLGFFQDNFKVLDLGCGMAFIPLWLRRNNKKVDYHGMDISRSRIQHCRNVMQRSPNYRFYHCDIQSDSYNIMGKHSPLSFKLPITDSSIDSIICHSLFTHLDQMDIATRYMSEIRRVLKPGGFLWTTWFSSPPNSENGGTARTVYTLEFIHSLLAEFEPIYLSGGETTDCHDQLEIACVKE